MNPENDELFIKDVVITLPVVQKIGGIVTVRHGIYDAYEIYGMMLKCSLTILSVDVWRETLNLPRIPVMYYALHLDFSVTPKISKFRSFHGWRKEFSRQISDVRSILFKIVGREILPLHESDHDIIMAADLYKIRDKIVGDGLPNDIICKSLESPLQISFMGRNAIPLPKINYKVRKHPFRVQSVGITWRFYDADDIIYLLGRATLCASTYNSDILPAKETTCYYVIFPGASYRGHFIAITSFGFEINEALNRISSDCLILLKITNFSVEPFLTSDRCFNGCFIQYEMGEICRKYKQLRDVTEEI
jgi:hypothetical protein